MTKDEFLGLVTAYLTAHPEAAGEVSVCIHEGVSAALTRSLQRAADMEVALAISLTKRFKGGDQIIKEKLRAWDGRTSCNWDWFTHPKKETS